MTPEILLLVGKPAPDSPLQVVGCVTREAAHTFGFPHTSVLLVPVTWDGDQGEPVLLLHRRSPYKRISPAASHFCSGHLTFDEGYVPGPPWTVPYLLEQATDEGAIRGANEELRCQPPFAFLSHDIHRFRSVGDFACHTGSERGINVEFSTAYVVVVPRDRAVTVWDMDPQGERQLEVRRFKWAELLGLFQRAPDGFADGAARILGKLCADTTSRTNFGRLLGAVAA